MTSPDRGAHRSRNASFDFSIGRSRKFSTDRSPVRMSTVAVIPGSTGSGLPFSRSVEVRSVRMMVMVPSTSSSAISCVNTGAAYRAFADSRGDGGVPASRRYDADSFASWDAIAAIAANDFEQVVPAMHDGVAAVLPLLRAAARDLRATGFPAIGAMSGSGATCFLLRPFGDSAELDLPPGARIVETQTIGLN